MKYIEHEKLKKMKSDISYWEIWFDSKFKVRHLCKNREDKEHLEINDAAVLKADIDDRSVHRWSLLTVWLADKEEVADGQAEEIGDVLSTSGITIRYCPICGEKLD